MNGNDDKREIDVGKLENVTGGSVPMYPAKYEREKIFKAKKFLNNMSENLDLKDAGTAVKPFDVCPVCHSTAVSFNSVENICMCQDCGYCEDRSK